MNSETNEKHVHPLPGAETPKPQDAQTSNPPDNVAGSGLHDAACSALLILLGLDPKDSQERYHAMQLLGGVSCCTCGLRMGSRIFSKHLSGSRLFYTCSPSCYTKAVNAIETTPESPDLLRHGIGWFAQQTPELLPEADIRRLIPLLQCRTHELQRTSAALNNL
jgi:hypothetical protein